MAGVTHTLVVESLEAQRALGRLSHDLLAQLAYEIGGLVEEQTRRRIDSEKTAPDGTPWAPWSARHAARIARRNRVSARSLLVGQGHLLEANQQYPGGQDVIVGNNLEYGAVHQFGSADGGGIPARPYLGLSIENAAEIEELVVDRLAELVR
ncbi:MAG: phage virion morphogenesis protein [Fuscovulum sp.]|nr:phage virion morphogenesis protein [Fuscovulum sp.]